MNKLKRSGDIWQPCLRPIFGYIVLVIFPYIIIHNGIFRIHMLLGDFNARTGILEDRGNTMNSPYDVLKI